MTHRSALAAIAAALLLVGCTSEPAPETATEEAAQPPAGGDLTEGRDWGEQVTDEQTGHLIKREGQWGGVVMQGEHGVVLRITEIDEDLECTAEQASEPEQDRFIGLEVEVETSPRMADLGRAQFPIAAQDFQVQLPDGGITGGLLGNAADCLPSDEMLPEDIHPGQHVTGMVVLDAPADVEAIVLDGGRYAMQTGWIWPLDAR